MIYIAYRCRSTFAEPEYWNGGKWVTDPKKAKEFTNVKEIITSIKTTPEKGKYNVGRRK